MPENRAYAGPSDATELMVSDDRYVLVVRRDLTDEQASTLGYTFDADDAVRTGRAFAVRTVTVSDELAAKLDSASFTDPDTDELVASWPKVGGTASAEHVVDDELLPATRPVDIEHPVTGEVETVASSELDRRAYDSAEAENVLVDVRPDATAGQGDATRTPAEAEAALRARLAEVEDALTGDDADGLTEEQRDALQAERMRINDELGRGA